MSAYNGPLGRRLRAVAVADDDVDLPVPGDDNDPDVDWEDNRSSFNPVRIAQRMQEKLPMRLHEDTGDVWVYRRGYWSRDRTALTDTMCRTLNHKYRAPRHRQSVTDMAGRLLRDSEMFVDPSAPDQHHIAVPGGLFRLSDGLIVPHDPAVQTFYALSADPEPGPTPRLDEFLGLVLPAEDHERFLDALAYAVSPFYQQNYTFLLVGSGGNGKSRALELLRAMVPRRCRSSKSLHQLEERFAVNALYGKVLNCCDETSAKYLANSSMFKAISGGGEVSIEPKGKEPFDGIIWAKLFFAANEIPIMADAGSDSHMRRWVIFKFPNQIEWDRSKSAALQDEMPQILHRLLSRLVGVDDFAIRTTELGEAAKAEMAFEADVVRQWWADTDLRKPGEFLNRTFAYADFNRDDKDIPGWCQRTGHKPMSNRSFFRKLRFLFGRDEYKSNGQEGWKLSDDDCVNPEKTPLKPGKTPLKTGKTPLTDSKLPFPETQCDLRGHADDEGTQGRKGTFSEVALYTSSNRVSTDNMVFERGHWTDPRMIPDPFESAPLDDPRIS